MRSETRPKAREAQTPTEIRVAAIENVSNGRFNVWLALGFALLFGFFLWSSPAVRTGSDDAYWFALQIEQGSISETMSVRELLFIPLMKVAFLAARGIGLVDRAFGLVGVINALLASTVALLQFLILHQRLRLNRTISLGGAGLLIVTFGFWRFATEVEVYPLGLFAAMGLLYIALANPRSAIRWAGVGVLGALAFLIHGLTAIVSVIAIPVFLGLKAQWRQLITYGALLASITVLGTFGAYVVADSDGLSYPDFYSSGSSSDLAVSPNLMARGAIGAGQAVISSGFLFAHDNFAGLVADVVPERSIDDEIYVAAGLGGARYGLMLATFLVSLFVLSAAIVLAAPGIYRMRRSAAAMAILAWLVGMVVFQLLRANGSDGPEAWLFAVPPLTMLITLGLTETRKASTVAGVPILLVLLATLLLHNGMGMAILSDEDSDRNIAKSAWVVANTGPGDMVVTTDSAIFVRYLRYESSANVVYLTEAAVRRDDLVEYLKQKQGPSTQVFLTADVLNVPDHIRHRSERAFNALEDLATALEKEAVLVVLDEFGGIYRYQGDLDQL